jgi:peptide deformylase
VKVGPEDILQLGHPALREPSEPVGDVGDPAFREQAQLLLETLAAFRQQFGFGRAIAAPQVGVGRRFIAVDLGEQPFLMIDPRVTWRSEDTFTMWDDCMSFPGLLVRLPRHRSISVSYTDQGASARSWERLEPSEAELMQHELDHLDGILAVDRAEDVRDIITREAYEQHSDHFARQVDYVIPALSRSRNANHPRRDRSKA